MCRDSEMLNKVDRRCWDLSLGSHQTILELNAYQLNELYQLLGLISKVTIDLRIQTDKEKRPFASLSTSLLVISV